MAAELNRAVTSPALKRHCQLNNYLNYQSAARGSALTNQSSRRANQIGTSPSFEHI